MDACLLKSGGSSTRTCSPVLAAAWPSGSRRWFPIRSSGDSGRWCSQRARHVDRLGYCLAQARHQLEGQWGLQTLELPQSVVCGSEPFHWFLVHLIANIERFRDCYNQAVQEYRRANRIRNAAHPVPDLVAEGPWIEAPLWIWTAEQPQRRRVFVCRRGREILVSDRAGQELRLPLTVDGDATDAVERLMAWSRQGVKIRSRALVTTLWARLALSDLFLHGIGGAKYDQVTDRLIETFFGLAPPGIMVLSATLYLPVHAAATVSNEKPSRHSPRTARVELSSGKIFACQPSPRRRGVRRGRALVEEKQRWIRTPVTHENAYARWNVLPPHQRRTAAVGRPATAAIVGTPSRKRNGHCGTRRCSARANMVSACIPNPI